MKETKVRARVELTGRPVISEDTGRKLGRVGDVSFISETGELMSLVLVEPTPTTKELNLETDDKGNILIPFSAVRTVSDFVIVSEKDMF